MNTTIQEEFTKKNLTWRYYQEGNADDWFAYINYFYVNQNNLTLFPPME